MPSAPQLDLTTMLSQFLVLLQQGGAGGVLVAGGAGQLPVYSTDPSVNSLTLTGRGTAVSPAVPIGDLASGFYSVGANNIGASINGSLVFDWNASRIKFAQPTQLSDGTAAVPALPFASDAGTGWYKAATGAWAWATGGVAYIKLDGFVNVSGSSGVNFLVGGGIAGASGGALSLDAANALALKNGANAQAIRIYGNTGGFGQYAAVTTLLATTGGAGTVSATNLIPAGCIVFGVESRVTTILAGAGLTTWKMGDGTTTNAFANAQALIVGTTSDFTTHLSTWKPTLYTAATSVVLTANAGVFSSGAVRITVHYIQLSAATS